MFPITAMLACLAVSIAILTSPAQANPAGAPPSVSSAPPMFNSAPPSVTPNPPSVAPRLPLLAPEVPQVIRRARRCRTYYRSDSFGFERRVRRCW